MNSFNSTSHRALQRHGSTLCGQENSQRAPLHNPTHYVQEYPERLKDKCHDQIMNVIPRRGLPHAGSSQKRGLNSTSGIPFAPIHNIQRVHSVHNTENPGLRMITSNLESHIPKPMFANLQLVTPQKVNPAAQESGTVSCPDRSQLIQNRRADVGGPPFVSSDQGVRWGSPMPQSDYAHNVRESLFVTRECELRTFKCQQCESTNVIVARNRDSPSVRTWRLKYETIVLWAKLGVNVVLFLDLAYGDEQSRVWLAKDLLHNVVLEKVSLEVIAKIVPAFAGIARANGGYMLRNFEERLVHETKEAFKLIWTIQTMAHGNSQIKGTPIFAIVKRGHLLTELLIVFYRQHILQDRYLRECLQFLFDTIPNNSRLEAMTKLIAGVQPVTLTTRSWLPTFCRNLVGKYRLTNGTSKFSAIQDACSAKWSPF